jgi:predicted RNA-binding Zn-ribbon protein involved in translation (DUF1610 family)
VSEGGLHIVTEEQRERAHEARRRAEICASCGRALGTDETVYIERFAVDWSNSMMAPVGSECASPEFLAQIAGTEPERCASCGRGMHYRLSARGAPTGGLLQAMQRAWHAR